MPRLIKLLPILLVPAIALAFAVFTPYPSDTHALFGGSFTPGRIIDDSVFYNSQSMTTSQIQAFLNAKNPNCDYNGTQPASDWGHPELTHAQLAEKKRTGAPGFTLDPGFNAPPYRCLTMYTQSTPQMEAASGYCAAIATGTRSAAQIINDVAKACGINPQVLIVLLEKEQSLVTDNWPLNRQLQNATGFACPDTAPCNPAYEGFFYQVYYAARQFKVYQANPNSYNYLAGRTNRIYWQTNLGNFINPTGNVDDPSRVNQSACGYQNVFIENQATAALYIYTPYQPNQKALANLRGSGDACSAYGNRNFWRLFTDWFGSTIGTYYNGVDYAPVFNTDYYLNKYPDLKAALTPATAFSHFIEYGMKEGRQASENFNVTTYRNKYVDLRWQYGSNLPDYYLHYAKWGQKEGRTATGDVPFTSVTTYNGINYSAVYDFSTYSNGNTDISSAFGSNNDTATLRQFVNYGMKEGRQAISTFNVTSYREANPDLRVAYGGNLPAYYLHYIKWGQKEGRTATGDYRVGTTKLNGVDYSLVYNFDYYTRNNLDVYKAYGLDDTATLRQFVNYGMKEGRKASSTFNVTAYKAANTDLQNAYGNDLVKYYMHYITWGYKEGRTAI